MLFCMRVMVGVIILYDHVHPVGAFAKTSKIDVSALGFGTRTSDLCSPEVYRRSLGGGAPGCFCVLIGPSNTCR